MNAKATDLARIYEAYSTIIKTQQTIDELNISRDAFCNPKGELQEIIIEGIEYRIFRITEELGNISEACSRGYGFESHAAKSVRNRLAHVYGEVDREILWQVIEEEFPQIIKACQDFCDDHGIELE